MKGGYCDVGPPVRVLTSPFVVYPAAVLKGGGGRAVVPLSSDWVRHLCAVSFPFALSCIVLLPSCVVLSCVAGGEMRGGCVLLFSSLSSLVFAVTVLLV